MRKFMSGFLTLVMMLVFVLPAQGVVFRDILHHWAEYDILRVNARGLMNGDGNGNFKPDSPITRQEAAVLLVRLTGGEAQAGGAVVRSSVDNAARGLGSWAAGYVGVALQQGMVNYDEVRILDWSGAAQRQEVAEWLGKALKLTPVAFDREGILNRFKDGEQINPQKAPYIIPLVKDDILRGNSFGYFKPADSMKRAEIAALLNRVLAKYPAPGMGGNLTVAVPSGTTSGLSVVGDVWSIDWNLGLVEVYSNGQQLRYQMSSGRSSSNFDTGIRSGDEVVLTVENNLVTSLRLVNERRSRNYDDYNYDGDYTVYKATLDRVNTGRKEIELRSVYYMSKGWQSRSGSKTLAVAGGAGIYHGEDKIVFRDLEDYEGETVYAAYDEDRGEVTKIRVREGSESRYDDEIKSISSSSFKLDYDNRTVYYDRSTIIIRDGELIDDRDLDEGDEVYVVVDRTGSRDYAAVVEAGRGSSRSWRDRDRDRDSDYDYVIYRANLDRARSREIELTSVDKVVEARRDWQYKSNSKTLEVASGADIFYGRNKIVFRDLEDYEDKTVYAAYDEDREEVTKIRVREGSESTYYNEVIKSIDRNTFKLEGMDKTIYYNDSTIVVRRGRLAEGDDLSKNDRVFVTINRWDDTDYAAVVEVD